MRALVGVTLLAACANPGVTATAPQASSASVAPAPAARTDEPTERPSATAAGAADFQISWAEQEFEGGVADLIADGTQLVAVGSLDGHMSWTSSDGVAWRPEPVPDASFDEEALGLDPAIVDLARGARMGHLVRLGDTLYSFGGLNFMDHNQPVGWRRTDGAAWEFIQSESEFFSVGVVVDAAASDEALLVATMGGNPDVPAGLDYTHTASTWLWTPQSSWVRGGLATTSEDRIHITAIAWSDGKYVAVGVRGQPSENTTPSEWPTSPAIWTSSDGRTWADVTPPDDMHPLCTVRALPAGGFVGIGIANGEVRAWTSESGTAWTGSEPLRTPAPPTTEVPPFISSCEVVPLEHGLLATLATDDGLGTLSWTSADGRTWTPGETLEISVTDVAALGSDVVAFGVGHDESGAGTVLLHGTVQP